MSWKTAVRIGRRIAIALALACAAVGAATLLRGVSWILAPSDDIALELALRAGNLRVGYFEIIVPGSDVDASSLGLFAHGSATIPTSWFRFEPRYTTVLEGDAIVAVRRWSLSLFAPLACVVVAWTCGRLVRPTRWFLRNAAAAMVEAVCPTAPRGGRRLYRAFRVLALSASASAALCFGTLSVVGPLAVRSAHDWSASGGWLRFCSMPAAAYGLGGEPYRPGNGSFVFRETWSLTVGCGTDRRNRVTIRGSRSHITVSWLERIDKVSEPQMVFRLGTPDPWLSQAMCPSLRMWDSCASTLEDDGYPCRLTQASVPVSLVWSLFLLFSAWPVIAFLRGPCRRARRRARGQCTRCGYNLTALTEPRCPECGTPFARVVHSSGEPPAPA